jgi:hypothetical protein
MSKWRKLLCVAPTTLCGSPGFQDPLTAVVMDNANVQLSTEEEALHAMAANPLCHRFLELCKCVRSILRRMYCSEEAAHLLQSRLSTIIVLIGHPQRGLIALLSAQAASAAGSGKKKSSKSSNNASSHDGSMITIKDYHFAGLERVLSRAARYLLRFTKRKDYMFHILVGLTPLIRFEVYDYDLVNEFNALAAHWGFAKVFIALPTLSSLTPSGEIQNTGDPAGTYFQAVSCDLRNHVNIARDNVGEHAIIEQTSQQQQQLSAEESLQQRNDPESAYNREMRQKLIAQELDQVSQYIHEMERVVLDAVSTCQNSASTAIIRTILNENKIFADIWLKCVNSTSSGGGNPFADVSIEQLGQVVRDYGQSLIAAVDSQQTSTNNNHDAQNHEYIQKLRAFDEASIFIEVLIRTCRLSDRYVKLSDFGRCTRRFCSDPEQFVKQLGNLTAESGLLVCPPMATPCWNYEDCPCSKIFAVDPASGHQQEQQPLHHHHSIVESFDSVSGIMWGHPHEPAQLLNFLVSTHNSVTVNVTVKHVRGPRHVGKTSKLLHLVHNSLPVGTDVLWVDCTGVRTAADMYAAFNSQLFINFTNIGTTSDSKHRILHGVDDTYENAFEELMALLRPGAVIVMDNLFIDDAGVIAESKESIRAAVDDILSAFLGDLMRRCEHIIDSRVRITMTPIPLSILVVTDDDHLDVNNAVTRTLSSTVTQHHQYKGSHSHSHSHSHGHGHGHGEDNSLVGVFLMAPLAYEVATGFACELFTPDPTALALAGQCLPGLMIRLARHIDIEVLRNIAREHQHTVHHQQHVSELPKSVYTHMSECVARELNEDETLCATCLLRGIPPFHDNLAWELCREAFSNDILRWKVAFMGLRATGWLSHRADRGYIVPATAMVRPVDSVALYGFSISATMQWAAYIVHWTNELVAINHNANGSCVLIGFDAQFLHIQNVFDILITTSKEQAGESSKKGIDSSETKMENEFRPLSTHFDIDDPVMIARRVSAMLVNNVSAVLAHRFSLTESVKLVHIICEFVSQQESSK